jgi:hypothetical protein
MLNPSFASAEGNDKDCTHELDYIDGKIVCKQCSYTLELPSEILKKISDLTMDDDERYSQELEEITKQESSLLQQLTSIQNRLYLSQRTTNRIINLQNIIDEKDACLDELNRKLESEQSANKGLRQTVMGYQSREASKEKVDLSQILLPFINYISDINDSIQSIDDSC